MTSVLRLGVYRERIEKYGGRRSAEPTVPSAISSKEDEDMLTVTVERQAGKQLGIRLTGNLSEDGIYIADIQDGSAIAQDGRLQKFDRILFINGQDVRGAELSQASALIQNNDKLSLVVGRRKTSSNGLKKQLQQPQDVVDSNGHKTAGANHKNGHNGNKKTTFSAISHSRSRSEPAIQQPSDLEITTEDNDSEDSTSEDDEEAATTQREVRQNGHQANNIPMHRAQPRPQTASEAAVRQSSTSSKHVYDVPEGDDYMAIYETIDRTKREAIRDMKNKSHSMEALETPTPSLKSFDLSSEAGVEKQQQQQPRKRLKSTKAQQPPQPPMQLQQKQQQQQPPLQMPPDVSDGLSSFLKKALRLEGPQLTQRTITIKKNVRESLGMRIGGGIGSNEGDTPIYVANIHPHGCIGKSKQLKKGDLLVSVDGNSLCGLTHSQAVATLKATINLDQVVLGIMDGPETSFGASNFIPSWMYWQKMPRSLQYPKTVILHRKENASWGFSIVGGADVGGGRPTEPIHVLFIVPDSPAAKDGKIKCGDRLLAVDGQTLENIPHHLAVSMLKRTSTRVVTEVVSWMGTEL